MEGNISIIDVSGKKLVRPKAINWLLGLSIGAIILGIGGGVYAQVVGHHHAFAHTRDMPWGMLIGVYAYFAILSTGLCFMAAITHVFHVQKLQPLANRMVWLSIISLLAAFTVIGLEIENPWRMPLNLIISPNVTSNIWWMGTLYGLAMGLLILEFYLILTSRLKAAIVLGLGGAVAEMLANSNLGSVFASLAARPFWYGSQLPIYFLASALLSGAAAVILFTHYSHLLQRRQLDRDTFGGLRITAKIMATMLFLIMLANGWKYANAYCGTEELRTVMDGLIWGPLATNFWLFEIGLGLVLPFILLLVTKMRSQQALSLAALMVLIGQFFSRYNLVVGGLMVPLFPANSGTDLYQIYTPALAEYLLVIGGFGVLATGFLVGEIGLGRMFFTKPTTKR